MITVLMLALADQPSMLLTAYWAGLIIGGGLILLSMIGALEHGSAVDADAGFDVDADAGADFGFDAGHADGDFDLGVGHADAGLDVAHGGILHAGHAVGGAAVVANWFSLRFLVFFVATAGATGVILSYMSDWTTKPILIAALLSGMLVGQGVHQLFRQIRRTSGDSTPRPMDYVNRLASVTIPILPAGTGEVSLQVRGTQRFVPATTGSEAKFNAGEEVVVVGYRAGVAQVISRNEYERQARTQQ